MRYYWHPESGCVFTLDDNDEVSEPFEEINFFMYQHFMLERSTRAMTIEANLERIANYLERLAIRAEGPPQAPTSQPDAPSPAADKPKRGRPAKITSEEKANAAEGEVVKPVVDDFLAEPPKAAPNKYTVENVRAALLEYAKARGEKGTAEARALLTKEGDGAVRLSPAKETPNDVTGVLKPEFYSAVVSAATAK